MQFGTMVNTFLMSNSCRTVSGSMFFDDDDDKFLGVTIEIKNTRKGW